MSWLKKLGTVLVKALPIILGVGGMAGVLIPGQAGVVAQKVLGDLNGIPQLIVTAEAMFANVPGQTGAQKLAAVAPLVQQLVIQYVEANEPGASKIKDAKKLAAACAGVASNMADALNSFGA
jgi:hypothetical protein